MKTAIIFSGQGAQHPKMMEDIFLRYDAAMEVFDKAKRILGRDIYALIMEGSQAELDRTENTQPSLFVSELALLRVICALGVDFDAALGFSLGEWAALVAVGAATEEDLIPLVAKRASAMQAAVPEGEGGMAVVLGENVETVQELCQSIGDISPANYNCPGNITVAGTAAAVERLLQTDGLMTSRVAISVPSHCALMVPAMESLRPHIELLPLRSPQKELIMNATGMPTNSENEIKENLLHQLVSPVCFQQSIEYLLKKGYDTFLELGPGKALSEMVRRTAKKEKRTVNIMQCNGIETLERIRKYCDEAAEEG